MDVEKELNELKKQLEAYEKDINNFDKMLSSNSTNNHKSAVESMKSMKIRVKGIENLIDDYYEK